MRYRAFLLTLIVVATLLAMFYLPRISVGDSTLRRVNLLSDVQRRDSTGKVIVVQPTDSTQGIAIAKEGGEEVKPPVVNRPDSVPTGMTAIEDFASEDGSVREMDRFYAALNETNRRPVRIAYFGDSFIEGDILTGDLRHLLQERFGGRGVGWVDISSVTEKFRQTITQKTKNWHSHYAKDKKTFKEELQGLSGAYFIPNGQGYTSIRCQSRVHGNRLAYVDTVTLYYMPDKGLKVEVVINDSIQVQPLPHPSPNGEGALADEGAAGDSLVKVVLAEDTLEQTNTNLNIPSPCGEGWGGVISHLEIKARGNGRLFGVTMDGKRGIVLDNLSMRGSQGWHIAKIPAATLRWFARQRPYDLIIVHFGLNVASKGVLDYQYYTRRMVNSLQLLRETYPNASILLVGASDRDVKGPDGELQTMDGVKALIQYQRRMAADKQIAFWNLFEAMGGELSMQRLAEQKKANLDYTHINSKGGQELAQIFFDVLMNGWENYLKRVQ